MTSSRSTSTRSARSSAKTGDYLIVEQGTLRKSKHPLPREFAHVDDAEQQVAASRCRRRSSPTRRRWMRRSTSGPSTEHYGLSYHPAPAPKAPARRQAAAEEERGEESAMAPSSPASPSRRRRFSETGCRNRRTRPGRALSRLDRGSEAAAGQRGEQVVAARLLVVPRERDLAHQVRVRLLEPGWSRSVAARRPTQRSQRMPVTWSVSVWTDTLLT